MSLMVRWSKLFLEFAISQGIGQTAGMLSGLIYVHMMPIDQYALYAMALTAGSFIVASSDLGTGSLSYFWRQDHGTIAARAASVRRLRSVLLLVVSLVASALLLKTASEQNIAATTILGCLGLIIATAWGQLDASISIQLRRLEGFQRQSYYCEAAGSIMRLLAALVMILTGITTALFGLVGQLLGAISTLVVVRALQSKPKTDPIRPEIWHQLFTYVMLTAPQAIVYIVEGPLVLWLAITFGGSAAISESFAVGRIAAIYALICSFTVTVVGPRLVRLRDDARLVRIATFYLFCLVLLSVAGIVIGYLAPSILLLLIGNKYAHLQYEVVLAMSTASIGLPIHLLIVVNQLRGWVRLDAAAALGQVTAIFVLVPQWSFQDAASVLSLMLILNGVRLFCTLAITVVGLLEPRLVKIPLEALR